MSEYDYDNAARELTALVCHSKSLQDFKRDKVCIRKELEAAHARGRTELEAENARLRAVVDALPKCRPWESGSGGHRRFGHCPNIATWRDDDTYFCDEHVPPAYELGDDELEPLPYAHGVRALATPAAEEE